MAYFCNGDEGDRAEEENCDRCVHQEDSQGQHQVTGGPLAIKRLVEDSHPNIGLRRGVAVEQRGEA